MKGKQKPQNNLMQMTMKKSKRNFEQVICTETGMFLCINQGDNSIQVLH